MKEGTRLFFGGGRIEMAHTGRLLAGSANWWLLLKWGRQRPEVVSTDEIKAEIARGAAKVLREVKWKRTPRRQQPEYTSVLGKIWKHGAGWSAETTDHHRNDSLPNRATAVLYCQVHDMRPPAPEAKDATAEAERNYLESLGNAD